MCSSLAGIVVDRGGQEKYFSPTRLPAKRTPGVAGKILAAALIDRVLHHCHVVNIRGNSYRMREHTELYRALQSDVDASEPVRRSRKSRAAGP